MLFDDNMNITNSGSTKKSSGLLAPLQALSAIVSL